jgi:tetratricopeptide (TPR) repeat protein
MDAYLLLAVRAREAGQPDLATQHMRRAWGLAATDLDGMRELAKLALRRGLHDLVLRVHAAAIRTAPDDAVLRGTYGGALVRLHRYDAALPELVAATAISPEDAEWWTWLARARLGLYQVDEAFAAYDRSVQLDPDNLDTLVARSEAELRTLRFADCEKTCLRILQLDPAHLGATSLLIRARRRMGRQDEALAAATEALARLGDRGEIRLERGRVYLESGDLEHAVEDLERAAELLPDSPVPYVHLIVAYTRLEMPEKAARAREKYEELEARSATSPRPGGSGMEPPDPDPVTPDHPRK